MPLPAVGVDAEFYASYRQGLHWQLSTRAVQGLAALVGSPGSASGRAEPVGAEARVAVSNVRGFSIILNMTEPKGSGSHFFRLKSGLLAQVT